MDFSSPDSFLASLFVGSIGLGLFLYGKKLSRTPQLAVGLTLMVSPYFVTGTVPMLGIAATLLGCLWAVHHGLGPSSIPAASEQKPS